MAEKTIQVSKKEYEKLRRKANLFDRFVETEELTEAELKEIKKAMEGPFLSESEFLERHPELK